MENWAPNTGTGAVSDVGRSGRWCMKLPQWAVSIDLSVKKLISILHVLNKVSQVMMIQ
jgi:hypothetical protein